MCRSLLASPARTLQLQNCSLLSERGEEAHCTSRCAAGDALLDGDDHAMNKGRFLSETLRAVQWLRTDGR